MYLVDHIYSKIDRNLRKLEAYFPTEIGYMILLIHAMHIYVDALTCVLRWLKAK